MNKEIYTLERKSPAKFGYNLGTSFDIETIQSIKDISSHKQYKELLAKLTEKNKYLAIVDQEITDERKRNDSLKNEL